MSPIISVIVPVYNTEKYVQDCIDCLLIQTMPELELILVDDASTDGSLAILRENEKKYPDRIRVIASPKNLRQGGARNLAIREAKGTYIGFCDSDDLVPSDMFEKLYRGLVEHGTETAFCKIADVPYDVKPSEVKEKASFPEDEAWIERLRQLSGHQLSDEERMELMICPIDATVTWLIPRDFLIERDLFFPECVLFEDNLWVPLMKAQLDSTFYVEDICYYYRRNASSTTMRRNNPGIYDRKKVENALIKELQEKELYQRLYPVAEYMYTVRYVFMTYGFFLYTYDAPPYEEMQSLMKELKEHFPKWRKNSFYRREKSVKGRFLDLIKYHFPILYARARGGGFKSHKISVK